MKVYERVIFRNKREEKKCEIKSFRDGISQKIGILLIWDNKRWHFFGTFYDVDIKLNSKYDMLKEIADYIDIDLHSFLYHITQSLITADSRQKERLITYIL